MRALDKPNIFMLSGGSDINSQFNKEDLVEI